MYKKKNISSSRENKRKKKKNLFSRQISFETFNNNHSTNLMSSKRYRRDRPTRPSSSTTSIFSQKLNFKNDSKSNFNILNLMIENNPNKYNYRKLKKKIKEINNLYSSNTKESFLLPKSTKRVEELYYNYNVLYGQNTSNLIRTYSPSMRPKSSSVNQFVKKMCMDQRESISVFTEDEVTELIKAKCGDIGIEVKEHMLSKFKDYCNSKCKNRIVDLTENYLGLNSVKFLGNILYNTDRISRLNLSKNNLGDLGIELLVNSIKNSYSLISLNISSNGITCKGGETVFKNLITQQSLIDFNISTLEGSNRNRNRLTSSGIKDIISYLKKNYLVEFLNLSGNSIKNEGFILVCKGLNLNQSLYSLKTSQNEIEEKGFIQGLKYIKTSITKLAVLDISKNKIMDKGLITLTNQLKFFPNLYSLNLSFCGFEFRGFENLMKTLQYNRKLEILNVSGNRLKSKDFDSIKPYFSFLGIRSLNMAKCYLCDESTFELGICLEQSVTIKKLNISDNEITDEGFKTFSTLFYKNFIIDHFDCSSNFLTDAGVKELIKSLEVNTTLKSLNLYDNQLHNEIGNLIIEVLETNKSLTFINLLYNRIQMKKIDEINKILKMNSENQKLKRVPNLIRSVKDLEFNPQQFSLLTTKIKEKKREQNYLFQKVKQEDKIYSSVIDGQQREIEEKQTILNDLKTQIKGLEKNIRSIEREIDSNERNFIQTENNLKDKIFEEKNSLNDEMAKKTYLEQDYENVKKETSHVLALTKEKYNLSQRALKKVENSLVIINGELVEKKNIFKNLMKIHFFRNNTKKRTSIHNVHSNNIKTRLRSKSTFKTLNSRPDINANLFVNKANLIDDKKVLESIGEKNKKKKIKNIDKNNNKINKNKIVKIKSDSMALLYFSKKNIDDFTSLNNED